MSKKTWKDHLLSSGVPLEYSVIQIFEELGIRDPGEYSYERKTAEGLSQVFSVDVHATKVDTKRDLQIECLVECKYRHDGTKWIFMPRDYGELFTRGPSFAHLFVTMDQCCVDRELDRSILEKFEDTYPVCARGIELLPDDANPKTIEQAVQQLRYAVVARAIDALDWQRIPWTDDEKTPIYVIIPIIVTTAELWRLKVGMTVEDIRSAEEISTVADPHDVLVLHQKPDNLNQKDTRERFKEAISTQGQTDLTALFKQTRNYNFNMFVGSFARDTPSLFIVISYKRVKTAMKNLNSFFDSDRLLKKREKKKEK
jgi:hypothetical protein